MLGIRRLGLQPRLFSRTPTKVESARLTVSDVSRRIHRIRRNEMNSTPDPAAMMLMLMLIYEALCMPVFKAPD